MRALILNKTLPEFKEESRPLQLVDLPVPLPRKYEVLIRISVCGVCHTDLDEIEGRTAPKILPIVLGHEIVGKVEGNGSSASRFNIGDRVGVGWIHHSTGTPNENLSPHFCATGRDVNGGYAEFMTVPEGYAHPIPEVFSDEQAAPLLCAGAIGYRALRLTNLENGQNIGLTGFGGSAHLVVQMIRYLYPDSGIFVFARDIASQAFARDLGANWAGDIRSRAPEQIHAIIDTTPAWTPVVEALANLRSGGRLVINAIRKEDTDKHSLFNLIYHEHLWMEKEIKTVANITSRDIADFLLLAERIPLRSEVQVYPFERANEALLDLKFKTVKGAKVLLVGKLT